MVKLGVLVADGEIVQLWLLLKQQANKQWVKTLSTHSKLACWWVILYSEKNNNTMLV